MLTTRPESISALPDARNTTQRAAWSGGTSFVTTLTAGQQTTLPVRIFSRLIKPRHRPLTHVEARLVVRIMAVPILLANRTKAGESD